jgi:hypothetical protein
MCDSAMQSPGPDLKVVDEALLEALRREDFQGLSWVSFAEKLAGYAHPIIKSWIASQQIFSKCSKKGIKCTGPPPGNRILSNDDADEMANEAVARAINQFRDKVLRPGRWSPQGGASLTTMFVTQCLFQFPNVYRRWLLEIERLPVDSLEKLELDIRLAGAQDGLVEIRDEIAHALKHYVKDKRVRDGLILRAMGYTMVECAEMLDTTAKALDSAIRRHWRNLS